MKIKNNDYIIYCNYNYVLEEIKNQAINWYNFNDNDIYYTNNCDEFQVTINHNNKTVSLKPIKIY